MPPLLTQRVEDFCRKNLFFEPADKIIVAISGGADSTALLHLLHESRFELNLIAAYIDHGLRPDETGAEIEFVRSCAAKLDLPFVTRTVDVKGLQITRKCSPEEAARIARYDALSGLRHEYRAKFIAVGHTADDQAEELLIRLIRGTGLKGLSGMPPSNGPIIRPLLAQSKASLIAYLAAKGLGYCQDSSNEERSFLRNKVRLDLLPLLEKSFNPSIRNTLLQTAEILQQDEALLAQISGERFRQLASFTPGATNTPPRLDLDHVGCRTEHPAIQRRILEASCWKLGVRPTFRTIHQLQELIVHGLNGARLHLPDGLRVHLLEGTVRFFFPAGQKRYRGDSSVPAVEVHHQIAAPGHYRFPQLGRELHVAIIDSTLCDLHQANVQFADADRVTFPLTLRTPFAGEKFRPLGSSGRKKIARILSDMKIRAELRSHYPLLAWGGHPIAIVGARVAEEFKVSPSSQKVIAIRWESI